MSTKAASHTTTSSTFSLPAITPLSMESLLDLIESAGVIDQDQAVVGGKPIAVGDLKAALQRHAKSIRDGRVQSLGRTTLPITKAPRTPGDLPEFSKAENLTATPHVATVAATAVPPSIDAVFPIDSLYPGGPFAVFGHFFNSTRIGLKSVTFVYRDYRGERIEADGDVAAWTDGIVSGHVPQIRGAKRQIVQVNLTRSDGESVSAEVLFEPETEIRPLSVSRAGWTIEFQSPALDSGEYGLSDNSNPDASPYTLWGSHTGIASGTDRFAVAALKNDWKVRAIRPRVQYPDLNLAANATFSRLPIIGSDSIEVVCDWSVGETLELPLIPIPLPIVGDLGYMVTVWVEGPVGVPYE